MQMTQAMYAQRVGSAGRLLESESSFTHRARVYPLRMFMACLLCSSNDSSLLRSVAIRERETRNEAQPVHR